MKYTIQIYKDESFNKRYVLGKQLSICLKFFQLKANIDGRSEYHFVTTIHKDPPINDVFI